MRRNSSFALLKLILVSLFVWSQAASLSHAAVYGDASHEHEGVVCDAGVLVSEDQVVLPVDAEVLNVPPVCTARTEAVVSNTIWTWPPERGPPPRSPPAIQQ